MKKIRIKKTFIAFIFTLILVFSAFTGCSDTDVYTEEEMEKVFLELYEQSLQINEFVWGGGIPYGEAYEGSASVYYTFVSEDAEYRTIEQFKAAILEVYSESYAKGQIFPMLFDGFEGYDDYVPRYREKDGVLQINAVNSGFTLTKDNCDLSSFRMVKSTAASCEFKITYTINLTGGGESNTQLKDYQLTMLKQSDGWRMDDPTY